VALLICWPARFERFSVRRTDDLSRQFFVSGGSWSIRLPACLPAVEAIYDLGYLEVQLSFSDLTMLPSGCWAGGV
jgi:hypothetical protein